MGLRACSFKYPTVPIAPKVPADSSRDQTPEFECPPFGRPRGTKSHRPGSCARPTARECPRSPKPALRTDKKRAHAEHPPPTPRRPGNHPPDAPPLFLRLALVGSAS
ncbi:hypothetical protein Salat_2556900 [Sesamum alatum]|uniref:Uncharacterized protein n=1 Tax=Sesamum alatum TaxID=300844 RepID=A0AAE1XTK8_9LAMI|nr:hypothetical protein Salat_2556900 [Sesamum alatum]